MKTWLIALPLVCLAGVAVADGQSELDSAGQQPVAAAPQPAKAKTRGHAPKHLPRGDIRQCLELKSYPDIIRCSERRRSAR